MGAVHGRIDVFYGKRGGVTGMYRQVFAEYFRGFFRNINPERKALFFSYISIGLMFFWLPQQQGIRYNWLLAIPVVFAVVSGAFHNVSLPFMMYLVPYTKRQREAVIGKLLYVKIVIPLFFAGLCDIAAVFLTEVSIYALILQLATVFCITCLCGMLSDDRRLEKGHAYGGLRDSVGIGMMLCQVGGSAMFAICLYPVSAAAFWVTFLIEMMVMLPFLVVVGKRWKQIRHNFAEYELMDGGFDKNADYH